MSVKKRGLQRRSGERGRSRERTPQRKKKANRSESDSDDDSPRDPAKKAFANKAAKLVQQYEKARRAGNK